MHWKLVWALGLTLPTAVQAQEIIKVPASSHPDVSRPDDIFNLPPDQWHFARQLWQGPEPCTTDQCEAGYTSGDLVVSVERAATYVRIMGGLRGCEATAFSEMEAGKKPSKYTRKRISKQVNTVLKGLGKSCKTTVPKVAALDVAQLFPAAAPAK